VIGHADRVGPFRDYCTGLVMPGERKSVEPMAAITAPGRRYSRYATGRLAWRLAGARTANGKFIPRNFRFRLHRPPAAQKTASLFDHFISASGKLAGD
jgi:hypothetical protein